MTCHAARLASRRTTRAAHFTRHCSIRIAPGHPRRFANLARGPAVDGAGRDRIAPQLPAPWLIEKASKKASAGDLGVEERAVADTLRPMTSEQAEMLKRLAKAAYELYPFKPNLTRTEADRRIAALAAKLKLLGEAPHTL